MVDTEDRTPHEETPPVHGQEQVKPRDGAHGGSDRTGGGLDRDVNIKAIVWTGLILSGITALSFVLMWFLFMGFKESREARDPSPLPMREAAEPITPPGPRLQSTPEEDLRRMHRQEETLLESYSLLEGEEAFVRIPVSEAMDLALERGLGQDRTQSGDSAAEVPSDRPAAGEDGMSPGRGPVEGSESPTGPAGSSADDSPGEGTPSHSSATTRSR